MITGSNTVLEQLPDYESECPVYWQNFFAYISNDPKIFDMNDVSFKQVLLNEGIIDYGLYNFNINNVINGPAAVFKSNEDLIQFKLKWG